MSRGALYTLLQNPIYRGEIAHQGKVYPGQHDAIVDSELWQLVQEKLAGSRQARTLGESAQEPSLLAGLIVDGSGQRMTPTHAVEKGRRYRYYVSAPLITGARPDVAKGWRVPAGDVEVLILGRLRAFFASEQDVGEALSSFDLDASTLRAALAKATELAATWAALPLIKIREIIRSIVDCVSVHEKKVVLSLGRMETATVLLGNAFENPSAIDLGTIELPIEAQLRRSGKGIRMMIGGGIAEKPDGQMIGLLRDAHATSDGLMTGCDETIDAMAQRLGVKRDYLSAHMRLKYLAPDIVRALASGRTPPELTPARLLSMCKDLPHDWQLQRTVLGFETR